MCPKNFLTDSSSSGSGGGGSATATDPKTGNAQGGGNAVARPDEGQATLDEIYCMHNLGQQVDLNVMNIVAMRATIEAHMMSCACQKSGKAILKAMRLDSKNAAILRVEDIISKSLLNERLYAFGTVSTEWSSKSILAPRLSLVKIRFNTLHSLLCSEF